MRYKPILQAVLRTVRPSADERSRALDKVKKFLSGLNSELKRTKVKAVAVLGGSYAKDTWLSGDYDVDVFVRFDLVHKAQNLSDLLERALKKWDHVRIHGSRDYFWVRDDIKYEIVPVLDIKKPKDAENVTDFSPLHVAWVNKNGSKFKDDIRLIKKFCKSAKCYGAESYIRGFSGHVVDILTIHYKGFIPLLKAAIKWKPKVVIDHNKVYKGKALLMLNKSKIEGPMVLIDPVQPDRNAAAALCEEIYYDFVMSCRAFLKHSSPVFFKEKPLDIQGLRRLGKVVELQVAPLSGKRDIVGAKLLKAFAFIRDQVKHRGFTVISAKWASDPDKKQAVFVYVTNKVPLHPLRRQQGPPIENEKAVKEFKKKHKNVVVRHGRMYGVVKREYVEVDALVRDLLKLPEVSGRVKKVVRV